MKTIHLKLFDDGLVDSFNYDGCRGDCICLNYYPKEFEIETWKYIVVNDGVNWIVKFRPDLNEEIHNRLTQQENI